MPRSMPQMLESADDGLADVQCRICERLQRRADGGEDEGELVEAILATERADQIVGVIGADEIAEITEAPLGVRKISRARESRKIAPSAAQIETSPPDCSRKIALPARSDMTSPPSTQTNAANTTHLTRRLQG